MKIKLLQDLPIDPRHGAIKGRVFDAVRTKMGYTFLGDSNESCVAFVYEAKQLTVSELIFRYKKLAKILLGELKMSDRKAKERYQQVFKDNEPPTLMRVQHVIAKEQGYNSWAAVTQACKR